SYLASSPAALDAQSYKRAWDPDTPRGRINRECLESYARSVGIAASTSTLTALRLLTWIVHARSEHRRLVADHGSAATGLAQRSTFLRLIEIDASQDVSPASS